MPFLQPAKSFRCRTLTSETFCLICIFCDTEDLIMRNAE